MGRPQKPETHDYIHTTLRIPPDLHAALKMMAMARNVTMNDVILEAVRKHIQFAEVNELVKRWKAAGKKGHLFETHARGEE